MDLNSELGQAHVIAEECYVQQGLNDYKAFFVIIKS